MRWIIDQNFKKVKLGTYTFISFIGTVLFFALAHGRWLPAMITGVLLNLLIYKKKDINSCIVAHGVANLLLTISIISTGSWHFWC